MRIFLIAATVALVACGGSQSSQASNAGANRSDAAAGVAMTAAAAAPVSGARALAIMHQRHEGMEAIGKANKSLRRELGGGSPDIAAVRNAAAKIDGLSREASGWFPAGTGPDIGKTGAKPEIWKTPKDFAAKLAAFQRSSEAFNAA
ncbi:MAG: cytochrome c, partial [Sphingomicrobium sp.]